MRQSFIFLLFIYFNSFGKTLLDKRLIVGNGGLYMPTVVVGPTVVVVVVVVVVDKQTLRNMSLFVLVWMMLLASASLLCLLIVLCSLLYVDIPGTASSLFG